MFALAYQFVGIILAERIECIMGKILVPCYKNPTENTLIEQSVTNSNRTIMQPTVLIECINLSASTF